MSTFLSCKEWLFTCTARITSKSKIKRDIACHILNGLNFNIKQRETLKAIHPTIFYFIFILLTLPNNLKISDTTKKESVHIYSQENVQASHHNSKPECQLQDIDHQKIQGCTLRKIEGSPVLWTCKIQCAQHMISMKKLRLSSCPRTKVRRHGLCKNTALQFYLKTTGDVPS